MQGALGWGMRLVGAWSFWRYALAAEAIRTLVAWRMTGSGGDRYWAWRVETAYGTPDAEIPVGDMVAYLRWRRRQRRAAR